MMHGRGKSDFAIVAVKLANKAERSAAELVEPRAETKGNAGWQSTRRTQSRISVSKALARIRQALAVWTRGRSRMRESRTYGSVRGARGDARPYSDTIFAAVHESGSGSRSASSLIGIWLAIQASEMLGCARRSSCRATLATFFSPAMPAAAVNTRCAPTKSPRSRMPSRESCIASS
jgi:hypothetical protein